MKILHTIAGFTAKSGGTSTCTYDLISAMHKQGGDVDLLTLGSSDPFDSLMGEGEEWIKALPNDSKTPLGLSKGISRFLKSSDYDIYHTNGLWMWCNHLTCAVARGKDKPYIITPHGMLYPDALHRSYWKKWPLIHLYFNKDIHKATCLHATCKQEMEYIRSFGYRGAIAVIPNPVSLPGYLHEIRKERMRSFLGCSLPRKLGFLGRLHPIKKIENFLYGASLLPKDSNFEIVIIGKGDEVYERFLRDEVARLKLQNVTFTGFVSGRAKYEHLADFAALFVPSDFENFGMIVTEALAVGTPVMASLGTPWEELNTRHCGWWVDRSPESIAAVIDQVLSMPASELLQMGSNGHDLITEKYTDKKVATNMLRLYDYILNGGSKPEFVYD